MIDKLKEIVNLLIRLLVNGNYDEIASMTHGKRLSADEIHEAIHEYGRRLVMPPDSAYDELMDVVAVQTSNVPQWAIEIPLWTKEEGRSDLSIELTITYRAQQFDVQIDDMHVL